jgi:hypothetical protein
LSPEVQRCLLVPARLIAETRGKPSVDEHLKALSEAFGLTNADIESMAKDEPGKITEAGDDGRPLRRKTEDDKWCSYRYAEDTGFLIERVGPSGARYCYTYDLEGKMVKMCIIVPESRVQNSAYDERGNLVASSGAGAGRFEYLISFRDAGSLILTGPDGHNVRINPSAGEGGKWVPGMRQEKR